MAIVSPARAKLLGISFLASNQKKAFKLRKVTLGDVCVIPLESFDLDVKRFKSVAEHAEGELKTSTYLERKWIQILQSKRKGLNSDIPGNRKRKFHEIVREMANLTSSDSDTSNLAFDAFDHMDNLGCRRYNEDMGAEYKHRHRIYITKIRRLNTTISHPSVTDKVATLSIALAKNHPPQTLHRIYHILEQHDIFPLSTENQGCIRDTINQLIKQKRNDGQKPRPINVSRVLPTYTHTLWDKLDMQKIFNSVDLRPFLPEQLQNIPLWKASFRHKTSKSLSQLIINNKSLADGTWGSFEEIQEFAHMGTCSCPINPQTNEKEHLATAIFDNLHKYHRRFKFLAPLLRMGPKYRPRIIEDTESSDHIPFINDVVQDTINWRENHLRKTLNKNKYKHAFADPTSQDSVSTRIAHCVSNYIAAIREAFRIPLADITPNTPAFHPNTLVVDEEVKKAYSYTATTLLFHNG